MAPSVRVPHPAAAAIGTATAMIGTAPAKERRAMTATAKKVYDGLTEHVSNDGERERIRQSLYRTDASALATILPAWREHWTDTEIEQYQAQGYLAMDGLLTS